MSVDFGCFIKIRTWLCIFGDYLALVKCIARIVLVCTVQIRQHHGGNFAACRPRFHRILWVLLQCIQRGVRNFAYIVYPFIVYADRKPAVAFIVCRVGGKTLRVQGIALRQGSLRRCPHISCLRYHSFLFALSIYPVSDGTSRAAKTARITSTTISSTNVNPRLRLFLSM